MPLHENWLQNTTKKETLITFNKITMIPETQLHTNTKITVYSTVQLWLQIRGTSLQLGSCQEVPNPQLLIASLFQLCQLLAMLSETVKRQCKISGPHSTVPSSDIWDQFLPNHKNTAVVTYGIADGWWHKRTGQVAKWSLKSSSVVAKYCMINFYIEWDQD